jgi:hypothetical protein
MVIFLAPIVIAGYSLYRRRKKEEDERQERLLATTAAAALASSTETNINTCRSSSSSCSGVESSVDGNDDDDDDDGNNMTAVIPKVCTGCSNDDEPSPSLMTAQEEDDIHCNVTHYEGSIDSAGDTELIDVDDDANIVGATDVVTDSICSGIIGEAEATTTTATATAASIETTDIPSSHSLEDPVDRSSRTADNVDIESSAKGKSCLGAVPKSNPHDDIDTTEYLHIPVLRQSSQITRHGCYHDDDDGSVDTVVEGLVDDENEVFIDQNDDSKQRVHPNHCTVLLDGGPSGYDVVLPLTA